VALAVGGGPGLADALDALHLADVDPGDAHRRVLADVGRVLEDRMELVGILEGQGLGDRQVGPHDQQPDQDQRVADPVRRVVLAVDPLVVLLRLGFGRLWRLSVHFLPFFFLLFFLPFWTCAWIWSSVSVPWLPGTFPIVVPAG